MIYNITIPKVWYNVNNLKSLLLNFNYFFLNLNNVFAIDI